MSNEPPMSRILQLEMDSMWKHLKTTQDGIDVAENKIGGKWEYNKLREVLDPIRDKLREFKKVELDIKENLDEILDLEADVIEEVKKYDDSRFQFLFNNIRIKLHEIYQSISGIIANIQLQFPELVQLRAIISDYTHHADAHIDLANHLLEREKEIMYYCNKQTHEMQKLLGILKKQPASDEKIEGMVKERFVALEGKLHELISYLAMAKKRIDEDEILADVKDDFKTVLEHARLVVLRVEKVDAVIQYIYRAHTANGYAKKEDIENVIKGIKIAKKQIKRSLQELKKAAEEIQEKMYHFKEPLIKVVNLEENLRHDFQLMVQEHGKFAYKMWEQVQAEFMELDNDLSKGDNPERMKIDLLRKKLKQEDIKFNRIARELPAGIHVR